MLDLLPDTAAAKSVTEPEFFAVDYTLFLNLLFAGVSVAFLAWKMRQGKGGWAGGSKSERILFWLAMIAFGWLAGGLAVHFLHA